MNEQRKLYISDLHLFHNNVTKAGKGFDNRPYMGLPEMHDDILRRWNKSVSMADHVYVLGDMIWRFNSANQEEAMQLLKAMNGNIHLITGNHDICKSSVFKSRFEEIIPYKKIADVAHGQIRNVILSHYYMPFYEKHYHNGILLHGHSHNTYESEMERAITKFLNDNSFPAEIYNVGCMYPYMDYTPRTLEQIIDGYNQWIGSRVQKISIVCENNGGAQSGNS